MDSNKKSPSYSSKDIPPRPIRDNGSIDRANNHHNNKSSSRRPHRSSYSYSRSLSYTHSYPSRSRSPSYRRSPRYRRSYERDSYYRRSPRPRYRRKTSRDNSAENQGNVLYVSNLPRRIRDDDLKERFEKFGKVVDISIVREPFSKESRGFGFVSFESKKCAQDALDNLNKSEIDGKNINVEVSKRNKAHKPTPGVYLGPRSETHRRRDGYMRRRSRSYRSRSRSWDRRPRRRSRSRSKSRSRSRSYYRNSRSRSRSRSFSRRSPGYRRSKL